MRNSIVPLILFFFLFSSLKTGKPAWMLFTKEGKEIDYDKMIKKISGADIILFGELHNNPISHWLQLELCKDLETLKGQNLIIGAEMFESDNQLLIDEYFQGHISQMSFESEARLWPNYTTDYKAFTEFARQKQLRFIATNIPRRYAAIVNSKGFEGISELSEQAQSYIAPLPIDFNPESGAYSSIHEMAGSHHHGNNLAKAQAIKDATMAYHILTNWSENKLFLHMNGSYHSNNYESIFWYLKKQSPHLKIVTISTITQPKVSSLIRSSEGLADYIICVDEDMTTTF